MKAANCYLRFKKSLILPCFLLTLVSCGEAPSNDEFKQIIYTEEPSYDYELEDDDRYGKAIYPNVAYRLLREIRAHNHEAGIKMPESGYYAKTTDSLSMAENLPVQSTTNEEIYLKDEYYKLDYSKIDNLDGVYSTSLDRDEFYYEGETLYHSTLRYRGQDEVPYTTPTVASEMENFIQSNSRVEELYDTFINVVKSIETEELKYIINPQEIKCYVKVDEQGQLIDGSLTININRYYNQSDGRSYRKIYRIAFDRYMPVIAVNNKVNSILANEDYRSDLKLAQFVYDVEEIRGDI